MKYYLTIYEFHPWEKNYQWEVDFDSEKEAHRSAGILSAIYGVPVMVATKPGIVPSREFISGTFSLKEKIKTIDYKTIKL
jgi:hypothetical protein